MPNSRNPAAYPASFYDLVSTVGKNPEAEVTIIYETEKEAKKLQMQFYSFRTALKADASSSDTYALSLAIKITVRREGKGWLTIFTNRDAAKEVKPIREALARFFEKNKQFHMVEGLVNIRPELKKQFAPEELNSEKLAEVVNNAETAVENLFKGEEES